jgi:DNA-binding winged helix-turn-helix (wHTH) protein
MIERPGDVVTREEFRSRLWPEGTFVDFEHSLNAAVKRLRAVLGDAADSPRFVETIPRRGYRFIASVETDAVLPLNQLTRDEQGAGGDGDRVRITVKLIDTANATQVWSATCERNACDTLAFQIEVAALHRGIAGMELPRVICV